jgi:hypothetical protein
MTFGVFCRNLQICHLRIIENLGFVDFLDQHT